MYTPQAYGEIWPKDDSSFAARYGRAVVNFRSGERKKALKEVSALLEKTPQDPYLHEMRGQFLFESGRTKDAVEAYRTAVRLKPKAPLLKQALVQVLLEEGGMENAEEAAGIMEDVLRDGKNAKHPQAWRLLATARGRAGDMGRAAYALAEYELSRGDGKAALQQVALARKRLKGDNPSLEIRLEDIRRTAERLHEKRKSH